MAKYNETHEMGTRRRGTGGGRVRRSGRENWGVAEKKQTTPEAVAAGHGVGSVK